MQTLAQILAGVGGDPYQGSQGISPLLSQYLYSQQAAPQQLGGVAPQPPGQQPQQQNPLSGLGSLGMMAQPNMTLPPYAG